MFKVVTSTAHQKLVDACPRVLMVKEESALTSGFVVMGLFTKIGACVFIVSMMEWRLQ